MATVLSSPGGLVHIRVSWDTYERILADHVNNSSVRFTYDQGYLEILMPSIEHDASSWTIGQLILLLAEERELDVVAVGSTTFHRDDLQRGFEPDGSFYFR